MDTLVHYSSQGITTDGESAAERDSLQTPPSPPSPTAHTTAPDPDCYQTKIRCARTAFISGDVHTATDLSYQLLEDGTVPFWARAQASLIVTAHDDAYPGHKTAYSEAVGIVESIKKMSQEQVEPNYKSLQLRIEDGKKRVGSVSSEEIKSNTLTKQQRQVTAGSVGGPRLSGIDDRDVGWALRKIDREQIDKAGAGTGPTPGTGTDAKKSKFRAKLANRRLNTDDKNEDGEDQKDDGEQAATAPTEEAAQPTRDCSCIIS